MFKQYRTKDNMKRIPAGSKASQGNFLTLLPWILFAFTLFFIVFNSYSAKGGEGLSEVKVLRNESSSTAEAASKRWTREQVDGIHSQPSLWKAPCKDACNEVKGQGKCVSGRCVCALGYGDEDCSFSIGTLYGDHKVYEDMKLRDLDATGWDRGESLYQNLVDSVQPNLIVEVGVWKGSSASKLAAALKQRDSGILVAVDTWLPVLNFWQDHKAYNRMEDLKFQNGYPDIFHTFTGNMVLLNLTECVVPFPATSRVASDFLQSRKTQAELIHIDAAHFYHDVVEDLELWWKHLRPGGIMLGDDWSTAWPGVVRAVQEHARRYSLFINVFNNKWWIRKPVAH